LSKGGDFRFLGSRVAAAFGGLWRAISRTSDGVAKRLLPLMLRGGFAGIYLSTAILGRCWWLAVTEKDPGIIYPGDPYWREKLKLFCAINGTPILEVGDRLYIGPEVEQYWAERRPRVESATIGLADVSEPPKRNARPRSPAKPPVAKKRSLVPKEGSKLPAAGNAPDGCPRKALRLEDWRPDRVH
jgi:hypothetical protein